MHDFVVAEGSATLIWKLRREMPPRASLMWRILSATVSGIADEERAGGAAEGFELRACGRGPAALFADLGEGLGVAGEEVVGGLLVVSATKPRAWTPTLSFSGAWPARAPASR